MGIFGTANADNIHSPLLHNEHSDEHVSKAPGCFKLAMTVVAVAGIAAVTLLSGTETSNIAESEEVLEVYTDLMLVEKSKREEIQEELREMALSKIRSKHSYQITKQDSETGMVLRQQWIDGIPMTVSEMSVPNISVDDFVEVF